MVYSKRWTKEDDDAAFKKSLDEIINNIGTPTVYVPSGITKLENCGDVDIIEFIESDKYLSATEVFDNTKWILDVFYNPRKFESDLIDHGLDPFYLEDPDFKFNELVLMIGMRSLKTALTAIMSAYELFKLTQLEKPSQYYGLAPDNWVYVSCCATSATQAKETIYNQLQAYIKNSLWFQKYLDALCELEKLPGDYYKEYTNKGFQFRHKKIECNFLHARPEGHYGVARKVMALDEIARFDAVAGGKSADTVYDAAKTTTKSFGLDGIVASISAPEHITDKICELYAKSMTKFQSDALAEKYTPLTEVNQQVIVPSPHSLGFHYSTWELSPKQTWDSFENYRRENPEYFWRVFGAVPSQASEAFFINTFKIDKIIDLELSIPLNPLTGQIEDWVWGRPDYEYRCHIDPGLGRPCRFGVCVAHREERKIDGFEERVPVIVVDFIHDIPPQEGTLEVDFERAYELIEVLTERFNIVSITSDRWNDAMMRQKLASSVRSRSHMSSGVRGIKEATPFEGVQSKLVDKDDYDELKQLIYTGRLFCYDYPFVRLQLKRLNLISGKRIEPEHGSTKDSADCLASVCSQLMRRAMTKRAIGRASGGVFGSSTPGQQLSRNVQAKRAYPVPKRY